MKTLLCALAGLVLSTDATPPKTSQILDPAATVSAIYRRLIAAQSSNRSYTPPIDIYTPRLAKLFHDDNKRAKGEVGCLDFMFWVNGQDWEITNLTITTKVENPNQETVIAKFVNLSSPEELHFAFRRIGGRWLLDDVRSVKGQPWTLSEILQCTL